MIRAASFLWQHVFFVIFIELNVYVDLRYSIHDAMDTTTALIRLFWLLELLQKHVFFEGVEFRGQGTFVNPCCISWKPWRGIGVDSSFTALNNYFLYLWIVPSNARFDIISIENHLIFKHWNNIDRRLLQIIPLTPCIRRSITQATLHRKYMALKQFVMSTE